MPPTKRSDDLVKVAGKRWRRAAQHRLLCGDAGNGQHRRIGRFLAEMTMIDKSLLDTEYIICGNQTHDLS